MNALLGTMDLDTSSVMDMTHPPVIKTMEAKAANGTLAAGLLVAKDSGGDIVAYVPGGASPLNVCVGVLVHPIDTTADDAAAVLRHGTVVQSKLLVGSAAPDAAAVAVLEALGIFVR